MEVKDCMSKNVCYCKPEDKVYEVAKLMCDKHIGCVPVCNEKNQMVGLITDRDIILRTVSCGKDAKATPVSDIMTCNVCSCEPTASIDEATRLMSDFQIRRIPVCDCDNKIVGILSLGDLAHFDDSVGKNEVCNTLENICECGNNSKNAE
jgi:CBS domain-containing protein